MQADGAQLTQTDFDQAWAGSAVHAKAERECWAPADANGKTTDPTPHFELTVASDGSVADVSYDRRGDDIFADLYPCLAKTLRGLRLSPGERRGTIQVNRVAQKAKP